MQSQQRSATSLILKQLSVHIILCATTSYGLFKCGNVGDLHQTLDVIAMLGMGCV